MKVESNSTIYLSELTSEVVVNYIKNMYNKVCYLKIISYRTLKVFFKMSSGVDRAHINNAVGESSAFKQINCILR